MHDAHSTISGIVPPSSVTAQFIGQIYIDTLAGCSYISKSLTTGDWIRSIRSDLSISSSYFSDWTWQNQGGATLTDGELGVPSLYIDRVAGNATDRLRQLVKAVPSSSYQLTVKLAWTGPRANYYQYFVGWKAALGASAKLELLSTTVNRAGPANISRTSWANETTYVGDASFCNFLMRYNFYYRIKETAGNIYLYYSALGSSWKLLQSYAKGAGYLASNEYNYLVIGGNVNNSDGDLGIGEMHSYIDIPYCKLENI